tara:strand:- start:30397 stop:30690 length:294 start_codon:yes stop_codon:yes gene_type:complete
MTEQTKKIYSLDDGHVQYWVHAYDEEDAVSVVDEYLRNVYELDESEIPAPEDYEVVLMDEAKARTTPVYDGMTVDGTVWDAYQRDPSRGYLGDSECD